MVTFFDHIDYYVCILKLLFLIEISFNSIIRFNWLAFYHSMGKYANVIVNYYRYTNVIVILNTLVGSELSIVYIKFNFTLYKKVFFLNRSF